MAEIPLQTFLTTTHLWILPYLESLYNFLAGAESYLLEHETRRPSSDSDTNQHRPLYVHCEPLAGCNAPGTGYSETQQQMRALAAYGDLVDAHCMQRKLERCATRCFGLTEGFLVRMQERACARALERHRRAQRQPIV